MLCSVLIASRNRFDKLLDCVRSVYDCASKEADFEVIVRLHKSDEEASRRWVELFCRWDSVQVIWGEDHDGYQSVTRFYQELIDAAKGHWCWHLNDDMVVTGEDWNGKLAQINNHWTVVQPELHRLNDSVYANEIYGPAPIHPREALGRKLLELGGPAPDMIVFIELVVNRGWAVQFLESVGIWHFPPWVFLWDLGVRDTQWRNPQRALRSSARDVTQ